MSGKSKWNLLPISLHSPKTFCFSSREFFCWSLLWRWKKSVVHFQQLKRCFFDFFQHSVISFYTSVADLGWFPGFHGTPLSAYYIVLWQTYKICWSSGTPYLMSSKINPTVTHLQVLWSEFWAEQTTQNTPFSIASWCGQRKSGRGVKVLYAQNPPLQNPRSATVLAPSAASSISYLFSAGHLHHTHENWQLRFHIQ